MFCLFLKFIYLWLRWVFVAVHVLSLVAVSGSYSLLWCVCFSLRWLLLLWSMGSRHAGFSSCDPQAQQLWLVGSRVQAQLLSCTGLVPLQHVGSSQARDRTHDPCIGRQILNRCTTREVPSLCLLLRTFNLFMFNVIINMFFLSAVLLIVLDLFL